MDEWNSSENSPLNVHWFSGKEFKNENLIYEEKSKALMKNKIFGLILNGNLMITFS